MAFSALASLINARNLSGTGLIDHFTQGFAADVSHYVTANNSQPLDEAIKALPMGKAQVKGAQNKAIGEAIAHAIKVTREALPDGQGWIGAVNGAFSKASKDARTPYLMAQAVGVDAFRASLIASGAFPEKTEKTAEEKAKAKEEKAKAQAEAQAQALKTAREALIASGELIPTADVLSIDKLSTSALIDELISRDADTFSPESVALIVALVDKLTATA